MPPLTCWSARTAATNRPKDGGLEQHCPCLALEMQRVRIQDLHLLPSLLPDLFPLQVSLCPFLSGHQSYRIGFPCDSGVKNPPANAGDTGSILGSGRVLGGRNATH